MAIRKAGDSMLQAAYRDILAGRDHRIIDGPGVDPLLDRLAQEGSAQMSSQEMREALALLKGRRFVEQLQEAPPATRIQALTEAIQDATPGAAMLFPVADRAGIYGASVVDADRLIAHEIANQATGNTAAFIPAANGALTHVIAEGGAINDPMVYGTLSAPTARGIYQQALRQGYTPSNRGILEDWLYEAPVPVGSQQDPYLRELLSRALQQGRTANR